MLTPEEARDVIRRPAEFGIRMDERAGCWLWPQPASTGFGPYLAIYEASFGEVPEGMEVFHVCSGGPRGCVRPQHLDIAPADSRIRHVPDPAITAAERAGFAVKIGDERRARKATRAAFARELGISPTTVRDWEEGRTAPTPDFYDQIVRKMGWDGLDHKFDVVVAVQRTVTAKTAGQAARQVLDELTLDGQPEKVEVVRASMRP
jgi:transcriptional regulator with XRE-family HTH domain